MKFTHDFQSDMSTLLAELDSGRPFAFNRFWDGELAILEGRDIPTADGWNSVDVTDEFRERLLAALRYRHPDYYVGIGCPCCNSDEWERLMKLADREPDDPQVTFSTLFVNGNYGGLTPAGFAWDFQWFRPVENVVNIKDDKVNGIIEPWKQALLDKDYSAYGKPLVVAAGPMGKIFTHELFKCGSPSAIIDIGSAFDLSGRGYHDPNHPNRKKICQWA